MAPAQRDLLSRDQFIDGLTEDDFRIRVRHAKPKLLDDAVKAVLELEAINRLEAKRRTEERAAKSSSAIPGVSFHEQLVMTMKEITAALREVSWDKPRDYRATRGRGQRGNEGKGLASGLRRTVECWRCGGIGHYRSQCPSFEVVADRKRSKWNTLIPQYSGVHVDCDRQPPTAVVGTITSTDIHVVYVEAKIAGQQVRCLMDTGAGVSILPESLATTLSLTSSSLTLEMATGEHLPVTDPEEVRLPVKLGYLETKHRLFVATVSVGVIPGVDFLTLNAIIDVLFSEHCLHWQGRLIPIQGQTKSTSRTQGYRVALLDDITLTLDQREVIVLGALIGEHGEIICESNDCLFEPIHKLGKKLGLLATPAVVNGRLGKIPVRILNVAGTVKLYGGKTFDRVCVDADLSGVTTLQPSQTTNCSVSKTTAFCSTRKVIDWSQFDWSQSEPTSAQQAALRILLDRYFDLFSTGLSDFGRTHVTRHHIATGDHHPLRQRPYRQPFSLCQEAEHQVQSMLENDIIKPFSSQWSSPVLLVPKKMEVFGFALTFAVSTMSP